MLSGRGGSGAGACRNQLDCTCRWGVNVDDGTVEGGSDQWQEDDADSSLRGSGLTGLSCHVEWVPEQDNFGNFKGDSEGTEDQE